MGYRLVVKLNSHLPDMKYSEKRNIQFFFGLLNIQKLCTIYMSFYVTDFIQLSNHSQNEMLWNSVINRLVIWIW